MKKSIFIAAVIGFALLGGSIFYLLSENDKLKAENEYFKRHSSNTENSPVNRSI